MVGNNKFSWFALLAIAIVSSTLFGLGISISPGANLTYLRQLGGESELPPLTIINVNEQAMTYTITPSSQNILRGYCVLPDIEWVRLGLNDVEVQPFDTVEIPVFVTVPDDSGFANRAWSFMLSVKQKPIGQESSSFTAIELAAQGYWFLETKSSENVLSKELDEPLVVSPSIWTATFAEDEPTTGELAFRLLNNDNVKHTYTFDEYTPYYGDEISGQKLDIIPLVSDEDSWVSDMGWITPKKKGFLFFKSKPKIKLNPGESAEQLVKVDIPPEALGDNTYEAVIFIKVDGQFNNGRFVRFILK